MVRHILLSILTISVLFITTNGQEKSKITDTESRVTELENFHEVMYPIWHREYPEKDFQSLREHNPEVTRLAGLIYNAELPGILRDKKVKWNKGLEAFKTAVDEYSVQAKGQNNEELLKSVENLHTRYENLVRIIRPVLKEIDQFHQALYVIYHTHLPAKDYNQINMMSSKLLLNAEAITNANLPSRLADKEKIFREASNSLLNATMALVEKGNSADKEVYISLIENIHTRYQKLEEIF